MSWIYYNWFVAFEALTESYPDSYQVFYWARIDALDEFVPTAEAEGRALFAPDDARELPFVRALAELYLAALQAATS